MHNSQLRIMFAYFSLAAAVIIFFIAANNFGVIIGWLAWVLNALGPFIGGFILAYTLSIPCAAIEKLLEKTKFFPVIRWKRVISVILVYLSFIYLLILAIRWLVPNIISGVAEILTFFPILYQQILDFVENLDELIIFNIDIAAELNRFVEEMDIIGIITGFVTQEAIMTQVGNIAGGAGALFRAFLTIVSSIYFLFESRNFAMYLKRIVIVFFSPRSAGVIIDYGRRINGYFKKYIFCLIIDCVLMALVAPIVLWALGSEYAIILGILLGVMNLIPYFGSILATLVAIIVIWLTQGLQSALVATVVLFILQQLDANVVQPRLYGSSLRLNPLLVIISVSLGGAIGSVMGGQVMGTIIGMIIAIPTAKVLMNILEDIMEFREKQKLGFKR